MPFCRYENCASAPLLLVFVIVAGVGAKHFVDPPTAPATVKQIFSFAATIAGDMIPWSIVSSDYSAYFHPRVSGFVTFLRVLHEKSNFQGISWRIFTYTYLGLIIPMVRGGSACLASHLTAHRSLLSA